MLAIHSAWFESRLTTMSVTRFGTKSFGDRLFASTWPESTIYELNPQRAPLSGAFQLPPAAAVMLDWLLTVVHLVHRQGGDTLYKIERGNGNRRRFFFVWEQVRIVDSMALHT